MEELSDESAGERKQSAQPDLRHRHITHVSELLRDIHETAMDTEAVESAREHLSERVVPETATNARVLHSLSLDDHDA